MLLDFASIIGKNQLFKLVQNQTPIFLYMVLYKALLNIGGTPGVGVWSKWFGIISEIFEFQRDLSNQRWNLSETYLGDNDHQKDF